jgi:superfamily II DNA/RNA helicase
MIATVVNLSANRGGLPEPEVAIEFTLPPECNSALDSAPRTKDDASEFFPTDTYTPFRYNFVKFNPVQSAVLPIRSKENNIVISAKTSAGKTIAAELVLDDTLARGRKVIYLSPFKALTEERHADWKSRYAGKNLVIMTGDYELTPELPEQLKSADIILMTSEMMDSRTRKFNQERNDWMREVGLVVLDEAHILSMPGRGDAVETGLMRFTRYCPDACLVLLSATVSNAAEIANWLKSLNGKHTDLVEKDYRPVPLHLKFEEYPEVQYGRGRLNFKATEQNKINLALDMIKAKPSEKFLVFVHSKKIGNRILKALQKEGCSARFHNADLNNRQRRQVEAEFKDTGNGIRVLVSTSTTAWGVNLPARNVVIVGIHRGPHEVDELDIIQMAGRAGRYRLDTEGYVYLVIPQGTKRKWEEIFSQPRPVTSVLNQPQKLLSHVLAEIYTGHIRTLPDIRDWFYRSLAHHQGLKPLSADDAGKVYTRLVAMDMIRLDGEAISITTLGAIAAEMYYPPDDVHAWYKNFHHLFASNLQDNDAMLAWALACTPSAESDYLPAEMNAAAVGWSIKLSDCGIKSNDLYVLQMEAVRLGLTGGQSTIETVQRMRQFLSDHERILNTIQRIDRDYAEWDCANYWRELRVRLGRKSGKKVRKPSEMVHQHIPSRDLPTPSLTSNVTAASDTVLLPCGVLVAGADLINIKLLDLLNESVMEIQARTGVKPLSFILFRHDDRLDGYAKVDDDFGAVAISLPRVWESAVQVVSDGKIGISLTAVVWLKLLIVPLIAVHMCGAACSNSEYYGSDFHEDEYSHALELSCNLIVNLSRKADLEPPNLECDPFLEKQKRGFPEDAEAPQWLKTAYGYFRTVIDHTGSPDKPDPCSQKSFRDYLLEDSKEWMGLF